MCNDWFDSDSDSCSISKPALDEMVLKYFGEEEDTVVKFQPPILIDGEPSSTYYRLEYLGKSPECDAGNCRGPHYCSEEVADAGNIWGTYISDVCQHISSCYMR